MRKKHRYSRNEFINIICKNCNLCRNIGNPTFCYDILYKKYKQKFIQKVLPRLLSFRNRQESSNVPFYTHSSDTLQFMFTQTFFENNLIKCKDIPKYFDDFRIQLNNPLFLNTKISKIKKRPKRKSNKYVVKAYPTFFTNDREGWKEEIRQSLMVGEK